MATIISKTQVRDGWTVKAVLRDGRVVEWHYLTNPDQSTVDRSEIDLKMTEIRNYEQSN